MVKYYNGEMYTIPKAFEEEVRTDEREKIIREFVKRHNSCNTNLCDKVGKGISCCECIAEQLKQQS